MSMVISSTTVANASYAVLVWEPVDGTGERLNVGALVQFCGAVQARALIREDVLRCMYGASGDGAYRMIVSSLKAVEEVATKFGFATALNSVPLASFSFANTRETWAENDHELFRQIVLMHSSLSVLAEEPSTTTDDLPTPEREVNQQWTTRVKEAIQSRRPDLAACFNRELILVDGGAPVKFPVLTPHLAAQFGLLKVNSQSQGMEDARAKMWKLALVRERNVNLAVAMVVGTPPLNDVTLSDQVQARFIANIADLTREAAKNDVELKTASSAAEAADFVIDRA
jgi:hypothetical protein